MLRPLCYSSNRKVMLKHHVLFLLAAVLWGLCGCVTAVPAPLQGKPMAAGVIHAAAAAVGSEGKPVSVDAVMRAGVDAILAVSEAKRYADAARKEAESANIEAVAAEAAAETADAAARGTNTVMRQLDRLAKKSKDEAARATFREQATAAADKARETMELSNTAKEALLRAARKAIDAEKAARSANTKAQEALEAARSATALADEASGDSATEMERVFEKAAKGTSQAMPKAQTAAAIFGLVSTEAKQASIGFTTASKNALRAGDSAKAAMDHLIKVLEGELHAGATGTTVPQVAEAVSAAQKAADGANDAVNAATTAAEEAAAASSYTGDAVTHTVQISEVVGSAVQAVERTAATAAGNKSDRMITLDAMDDVPLAQSPERRGLLTDTDTRGTQSPVSQGPAVEGRLEGPAGSAKRRSTDRTVADGMAGLSTAAERSHDKKGSQPEAGESTPSYGEDGDAAMGRSTDGSDGELGAYTARAGTRDVRSGPLFTPTSHVHSRLPDGVSADATDSSVWMRVSLLLVVPACLMAL
ncbi:hypothetical protein DQ04_06471060 [Trypanosoma grayi]|uniref:hypothetical protein n=1 Tax=Trypanosoma grayi TaxID=71804 RepID=UPI0004F456CC|nr:hypothetical protein DQ04_06471060 [Trypanosoma grayi]KEG08777.1 hypothetical protein DQ04_06471060 [Trypanosoma grayi]